jgi:hypothetical protein
VDVAGSTIFGNGIGGLYITNSGSQAVIGDATLTDGDGNLIYDNGANGGIDANGAVSVDGNVVYGETATYGIELAGLASATENVVYGGQDGIDTSGPSTITDNRLYDNTRYGIDITSGTYITTAVVISGNVIYSDATGIIDQAYYAISSLQISNNLIYANTTVAISVIGQSNVSIVSNTFDQPAGDGVDLSDSNTNTHLLNNIFVVGTGSAINVASDSETGFTSDYNMFDVTGIGAVGTWEGLLRVTLGAWSTASFGDFDSISGNPLFVNPTGAEGTLGYLSAAQPGYDDDFHLQSLYQNFAGGSTAPIIVASKAVYPTIVGGTSPNQSPAIDRGSPTSSYSFEPSATSIWAITATPTRHRKAPANTSWCWRRRRVRRCRTGRPRRSPGAPSGSRARWISPTRPMAAPRSTQSPRA